MPTDLDLEAIDDELHRSRHSEVLMADLSRRYMQKLIDTIYELQEMVNQEEERANERGRRLAEVAAPAPSPPEIVLPEPDQEGSYWIGKYHIIRTRRFNKYVVYGPNAITSFWEKESEGEPKYFDTPLDAARALAALGEGPGAMPCYARELESENARLRAALVNYANHAPSCPCYGYRSILQNEPDPVCICGLDELLQPTKGETDG